MPQPKQPHPPRLGELTPVAELSSSQFPDDALVSGLQVARLACDWHSSEFIEWGDCLVEGGTMADSQWYRPSLYDLELRGVDAANVQLNEAGWRRSQLTDCRMTGLDVSSGVLSDVTFSGCLMDLTNLRFAKLTRVRFERCRLRGADFTEAKLIDVSFEGCDLSGAQVHQMSTSRGRISGCELEGLKSVSGLRGMSVTPVDLMELTALFGRELGVEVELP